MTTLTIVFKGSNNFGKTTSSQQFQIASWETHSAFGFLELTFADGSSQYFNLSEIHSFQISLPPPPAPTK